MGWVILDGKKVREITRAFIHISASPWGDDEAITSWHIARGWDDDGYNHTITNGYRTYSGGYIEADDGIHENARPDWHKGAHVKGCNHDSTGLCFISLRGELTLKQILTGRAVGLSIMDAYQLTPDDFYGHYQVEPKKTCPGFRIEDFRAILRGELPRGGNYDPVLPIG